MKSDLVSQVGRNVMVATHSLGLKSLLMMCGMSTIYRSSLIVRWLL